MKYCHFSLLTLLFTFAFLFILSARTCELNAENRDELKLDLKPLISRADGGDAEAQVKLGLIYLTGSDTENDDVKGVKWLEKAAAQKNASGIYYLAHSCLDGRGTKKDEKRGMELLRQAAEMNYPPARMFLGKCCILGEHVEKDVKKGKELLQDAALQENPEAQYLLGILYSGIEKEIPENRMKRLKWLTLAASQGFVPAQTLLGKEYLKSENYFWAREWLEDAAGSKDPEALAAVGIQELLGWGDESAADSESALENLTEAARLGNAEAQYFAGLLNLDAKKELIGAMWLQCAAIQGNKDAEKELEKRTFTGETCGVMGILSMAGNRKMKDFSRAKSWFEKGAALEDARAFGGLGRIWEYGVGVSPDFSKAVEYYRKGAAMGSADCADILAMRLYTGSGVPQNFTQTLKVIQEAEEREEISAPAPLRVRALCAFFGDGLPQDRVLAEKLFQEAAGKKSHFAQAWLEFTSEVPIPENAEKAQFLEKLRGAAEGGNRFAQYLMAEACTCGWLVPRDLAQAFHWYELAAAQGFTPAQTELFYCCETGTGTAVNTAEAQKWLEAAAKNDETTQGILILRQTLGD